MASNPIIYCKFCSSSDHVKRGFRKTKTGSTQLYFCKDCLHTFTKNNISKRTNPKIIIDTVILYNLGYTLPEVIKIIKRKYKTRISKSAADEWIREFSYRYLAIRKKMRKRYGTNIILSKTFQHADLYYIFKYHKAKLEQFTKHHQLKNFIKSLPTLAKDQYFTNTSRCSQLKLKPNNIIISNYSQTKFNTLINNCLKLCANNKQRHNIVENFLLATDRDTIAIEVPIWFYDKQLGKISGHIDILQIKDSKIHILDYKPEANKENKQKVTTQLYLYALALSFRTNLPLKHFTCSWFDQNNIFTFNPNNLIVSYY